MKKIYAISRYSGTFGQTPAGCHTVLGEERIEASARVCQYGDGWREEQEAFMASVRPVLQVDTCRDTLPCESGWVRTIRGSVGIPMVGISGFNALIGLLESDPVKGVGVSTPGIRLVIGYQPPELDPGSVQMDGTSLAYQREMLAGRV